MTDRPISDDKIESAGRAAEHMLRFKAMLPNSRLLLVSCTGCLRLVATDDLDTAHGVVLADKAQELLGYQIGSLVVYTPECWHCREDRHG